MTQTIKTILSICLSTYIFSDAVFHYTPVSEYVGNLAPIWALFLVILTLLINIIFIIVNVVEEEQEPTPAGLIKIDKMLEQSMNNRTKYFSWLIVGGWIFITSLGALYLTTILLIMYLIILMLVPVLAKDIFNDLHGNEND